MICLKKLVYFQKHVILHSEFKQKNNNNIVFVNQRQDSKFKSILETAETGPHVFALDWHDPIQSTFNLNKNQSIREYRAVYNVFNFLSVLIDFQKFLKWNSIKSLQTVRSIPKKTIDFTEFRLKFFSVKTRGVQFNEF